MGARGQGQLTDTAEENLRARGSSSLWRPLRVSTFRNLLVADVVSDIGTFMQRWGCMVDGVTRCRADLRRAHPDRLFATNLLLALPAGSAGDIFDRRKLVLNPYSCLGQGDVPWSNFRTCTFAESWSVNCHDKNVIVPWSEEVKLDQNASEPVSGRRSKN
jgi:hypothetical protein